jgi:hypothetical protein
MGHKQSQGWRMGFGMAPGWICRIGGDWVWISFTSRVAIRSAGFRECGDFTTGSPFTVMYMSYIRREAGGWQRASLYELLPATDGSTAGARSI